MENPLVSVAVITYNQKEYLRECVDSILSQSYDNLEIVIADDASTDGTQAMLLEYSKNFPAKFTLCLAKENQGITKNSNIAHFACKGKYIAWVGGDDLFLSGKISAQVEYMENHPECSLCYHDIEVFNSSDNNTLHYCSEKRQPRLGGIRALIRHGTFIGACSTMIRADHAPKLGFCEDIPVASDWLFWVECLGQGGQLGYLNRILSRYRRHESNVTSKYTPRVIKEQLDSCTRIIVHYPQYTEDVLYRMSNILRYMSVYDSKNYYRLLKSSLAVHFNWKSLFLLLLFIISFGKFKRQIQ